MNQNADNHRETVYIFALYFFLIAGGLWHILNVFQTAMRVLATPLILGLAVWVFLDIYKKASAKRNQALWAIGVVFLSFLVELLGVKTGKIFGHYAYGDTLSPKLLDVPIAIGFAWLVMLLSSIAIVNKVRFCGVGEHRVLCSGLISLLMVLFDSVMEPAAVKLGYWHWEQNAIPIQNYIVWFVISFIFSFAALKLNLFNHTKSRIAIHAYFAQLIYFALVILK
ncbi:carotenoid biosynthesis protein [candidate division KSB1 bacterium]|nr:carotenoid biosynthesis protein [candidate division KSB1 bacterium]